jgi:hypothetical protein
VVQGVYILTSTSQRFNGGGGRSVASLTLKGADLGTGLLLGVTAAMQPETELLSAISFNFLEVPVSSAIAIDMPSIAIEELVFMPQVSIQSSVRWERRTRRACLPLVPVG